MIECQLLQIFGKKQKSELLLDTDQSGLNIYTSAKFY